MHDDLEQPHHHKMMGLVHPCISYIYIYLSLSLSLLRKPSISWPHGYSLGSIIRKDRQTPNSIKQQRCQSSRCRLTVLWRRQRCKTPIDLQVHAEKNRKDPRSLQGRSWEGPMWRHVGPGNRCGSANFLGDNCDLFRQIQM